METDVVNQLRDMDTGPAAPKLIGPRNRNHTYPRFLEMLRSYASALFPDQWQSVFGAMMLAIVLFLPGGLDRLIAMAWSAARKTPRPGAIGRGVPS